MGVLAYLGNKALSIILFIIAIGLLISIKSVIIGWVAIFIGLAGIYFWKHAPF